MVYMDKFKFSAAERLWDKADASGWPSAVQPQSDARVKEAQKLLYKIPEEARGAAVDALKALLGQ